MKAIAIGAVAAVALCALVARAGAWPMQTQTDTKTYDVDSDAQIAVDATDADVSIKGWSSDKVQVVTKKTAWSSDDFARIDSTVDATSDHVSVSENSRTDCINCGVSYELRVPAGAHVTVSTASGDVCMPGTPNTPKSSNSACHTYFIDDVGAPCSTCESKFCTSNMCTKRCDVAVDCPSGWTCTSGTSFNSCTP